MKERDWKGYPIRIQVDATNLEHRKSLGAHFKIKAATEDEAITKSDEIIKRQFPKLYELGYHLHFSKLEH